MGMKKDFIQWHGRKRYIEHDRPRIFFKEREVFLCHLGENIGFEQDGRGDDFLRPVVVLKKFNLEVLWAVPLTRTEKENDYFFPFVFDGNKKSVAVLSQIRLVDAKRLKYKMGDIKPTDFESMKNKIRQAIA